jgi:hypothetical protein
MGTLSRSLKSLIFPSVSTKISKKYYEIREIDPKNEERFNPRKDE